MNNREKLIVCERFIRNNGYKDASIVKNGGDDSEMIVFSVPNITAKYPNEKPSISVAFADGSMNGGEIRFDIMQVLCFISSGVPDERLMDIQRFCADFNKAMQIGTFGVDFKNGNVYFKCAQVVDRNISKDFLTRLFDDVFTMILFYFGYSYEILIEMSYGMIGYGSTPVKLRERRRILEDAMQQISSDRPVVPDTPPAPKGSTNFIVNELLQELQKSNPDILKEANIKLPDAAAREKAKAMQSPESKKKASAEETARKILNLAQSQQKAAAKTKSDDNKAAEGGEDWVREATRRTMSDKDASPMRNQMPSIEMFAKREERKPEPPLDMESLRKALEIEQEERERVRRTKEQSLDKEITEHEDNPSARADAGSSAAENAKSASSSESLVQRLRKWTNS